MFNTFQYLIYLEILYIKVFSCQRFRPPVLTSGKKRLGHSFGWNALEQSRCWSHREHGTNQRTAHTGGRRQGKLEFAHSSRVSTFPDGAEGVQGGATCSAEPEQSSDYRKGWEKQGIVPAAAAAGLEPRLNPLEKGTTQNYPAKIWAEFGNAELRAEANLCLECKPQQLQPRPRPSTPGAGLEYPFSHQKLPFFC